jgi:hypothetical protein
MEPISMAGIYLLIGYAVICVVLAFWANMRTEAKDIEADTAFEETIKLVKKIGDRYSDDLLLQQKINELLTRLEELSRPTKIRNTG